MLAGSYHNGFAPRDGVPLYPELWRGCVGAWAPCLGPSGLTLRDWSGYQRHGTFTNLTAANAWQLSFGRYAIRTSGSTESIGTSLSIVTSQLTMSCWFRRALAGAFVSIGAFDNNNSRFGLDAFSDGVIYFEVANGANTFGSVALNDTLWHHAVMVYDGNQSTNATRLRVWIDGTERGLTYGGTIPSSVSITNALNLCNFSTRVTNGEFDDCMVFRRVLNTSELRILSSRRGIAYDLAPRRRSRIFTGGFRAHWAARKAQILGGGLQ